MDTLGSERPSSSRWAAFRSAFCWIAGLLMIFGGLLLFANGDGWLNEQIRGLLTFAAGFCLLPPILRRVRRRLTWAKSVWVPVAGYAFVVALLPFILKPLSPSATEQAQMRAQAMIVAEGLLDRSDHSGARQKLSSWYRRPDPDGSVETLLRRITDAENVAKTRVDAAKAAATNELKPAVRSKSEQAITPAVARLGAASRFSEFDKSHPLRPVQDALNAGDVDGALSFLSDAGAPGLVDASTKQRLMTAIQKASDTQLNRSPEADYVERLQTYWIPEVQALPATAPEGGVAYGQLLTQLTTLRSYVADGKRLALTPAQKVIFSRFSSALSSKQKKLFPSFRRQYGEMLAEKLFRRDIFVSTAGQKAETLQFTGPIFVRNANIEDMQTELSPILASMRYRRVEYRWSKSEEGSTHYNLRPPADGDTAS